MKGSITRVGQYIVENFKNKNYLKSEGLANATGSFYDFITNQALEKDGNVYKLNLTTEDKERYKSWTIKYNNVNYNVNFEFKDKVNVTDTSSLDIPPKKEGINSVSISQEINSLGQEVVTWGNEIDNVQLITTGDPVEYYRVINGATKKYEYTANYPTIVLQRDYATGASDKPVALWISNNGYFYPQKDELGIKLDETGKPIKDRSKWIRIIKEFTNDLDVFIDGDNFNIKEGQEGDGAPKEYTAVTLHPDMNEKKKNTSEFFVDATMTISNSGDDSIRDVFDFSFPVEYDFQKGE